MAKHLHTMQKIQVWSLSQEYPLEKGMATHSSILAWSIPWDKGAWWAIVHGVAESDTTERLSLSLFFTFPSGSSIWWCYSWGLSGAYFFCIKKWILIYIRSTQICSWHKSSSHYRSAPSKVWLALHFSWVLHSRNCLHVRVYVWLSPFALRMKPSRLG